MDDMLIGFGSAVKVTSDGKISGHLVLFSDASTPDLEGDYFTKDTDFDIEDGAQRSIYYSHGFDKSIGNAKIGKATLSIDDVGVWLDGQLDIRDKYANAVLTLAEKGAMGLSSGSLSHLVRREASGKSFKVTAWPIGEASCTPTPAEPRTQVVAAKTWAESLKGALGDGLEETLAIDSVNTLTYRLTAGLYNVFYPDSDEGSVDDRMKAIEPMFTDFSATALRVIRAILATDDDAQMKSFLRMRHSRADFADMKQLEATLREAGFSRRDATAIASKGYKGLQSDSGEPDVQVHKSRNGDRFRELEMWRAVSL